MKVHLQEIVEMVCLQLGTEAVQASDRLQEDLAADSADVLNLVVAVEDRYAVAISEEDVAGVRTVEDLHRLASALATPG